MTLLQRLLAWLDEPDTDAHSIAMPKNDITDWRQRDERKARIEEYAEGVCKGLDRYFRGEAQSYKSKQSQFDGSTEA